MIKYKTYRQPFHSYVLQNNDKLQNVPTALGSICLARCSTTRMVLMVPARQQFMRLRWPTPHSRRRLSDSHTWRSCDWTSGSHCSSMDAACVLWTTCRSPSTNAASTTCTHPTNETFYLTTHSTHFILRLYGVGHMVKDHSDSERVNLLPPHRLLFSINSKGSFIWRERNVLFNDALNTFDFTVIWHQIYGKGPF